MGVAVDARMLADFARSLPGFSVATHACPVQHQHMGATLTDAVLQAGLNYETVVWPRVKTLQEQWPTANTTTGFVDTLYRFGWQHVLGWKNATKPLRLLALTAVLHARGVETEESLSHWLSSGSNCDCLQTIHGIGPKTVDYLKILVGLPTIAVDRHVRTFVALAGVEATSYNAVRTTVAYAADFLNVRRQDFDAAIWAYVVRKGGTLKGGTYAGRY